MVVSCIVYFDILSQRCKVSMHNHLFADSNMLCVQREAKSVNKCHQVLTAETLWILLRMYSIGRSVHDGHLPICSF